MTLPCLHYFNICNVEQDSIAELSGFRHTGIGHFWRREREREDTLRNLIVRNLGVLDWALWEIWAFQIWVMLWKLWEISYWAIWEFYIWMSEKSGKSETSTSGIESGYCEKYDNSRSGGESETCEKYGDSGRGREEILKTVTNLRLLDLEDILEATQHLWRIQMMRRNMRLLGQLEQNIESVEKEYRGGGLEQESEREGEYRKSMEQNESSGNGANNWKLWRLWWEGEESWNWSKSDEFQEKKPKHLWCLTIERNWVYWIKRQETMEFPGGNWKESRISESSGSDKILWTIVTCTLKLESKSGKTTQNRLEETKRTLETKMTPSTI